MFKLGFVAAIVAAIAIAAFFMTRTGNNASPTNSATNQGPARVVHVHGLGINPRDGSLYAATHTGLFQIRDGVASRVGNTTQDTMGFTVVGPDEFLGSGHPAYADYQAGKAPPLLGLIKSKDAGKTWDSVSLRGKADFHALRVVSGRLYGFDSTGEVLMVSTDQGKSWETRPKILLFDLAVHPDRSDSLLGTSGTGLIASDDAGKTWKPAGSQPYVLLSWPAKNKLWALDSKGGIFLSVDEGRSWQSQTSLPGAPEAFLDAGNKTLFVAIREQGIYTSDNDGESWRVYYRDPS